MKWKLITFVIVSTSSAFNLTIVHFDEQKIPQPTDSLFCEIVMPPQKFINMLHIKMDEYHYKSYDGKNTCIHVDTLDTTKYNWVSIKNTDRHNVKIDMSLGQNAYELNYIIGKFTKISRLKHTLAKQH